ncbi:MAG: SDR family oxidoreductase [bacterium]|nr:SDR family oxidoreductase [bacterium]
MTYTLGDRVVIITGAGSGIGRAAALTAAAAGANVGVADISDSAHETVKLIEEAGGQAFALVGDIGDPEQAQNMVDEAAAKGPLKGLANNAGIMDYFSGAAETAVDLWDRVMRINAGGTFYMTRAAIPHMLEAGGGSIVNTASEAGIRGAAAGAAYTASKHAVVGLTRNTAYTYGRRGIRCNAVCPGGVETNIMSSIDPTKIDQEGMAAISPVHQTALGMATPQQQADLIVFLLADEASNVSGAIIPNDGGWFAG